MIILLSAYCEKILRRELPTVLTDGVNPARSALVDSQSKSSTPPFPISPILVRSIIFPSIGETSSLKSPEWKTIPTGVFTAIAQASAIEWFTCINSALKTPRLITSPASTVYSSGSYPGEFSSSFPSIIPRESRVPYIGTFIC